MFQGCQSAPSSAFLQLLVQTDPPWAFVGAQSCPVTAVSVNPAFIWYPWCVQHGPGTTLETVCCQGAQNTPRESASPHLTRGCCAHRWKPQINVNKSAGRGSWGCWRFRSIYLNQGQKRNQSKRLNRVIQDLKAGMDKAGHRQAPFLLPTPVPMCWETDREASGAQSLKLESSKNRDFKGLQSKKRW